jgi:hypothetical protein
VQHRVQSLNSGNGNASFLCEFDRRAKVSLNFHWPAGGVILVHGALCLGRRQHLFHNRLAEARLEIAPLSSSKIQKFVHDAVDNRANADFLEELSMRWRLEDHAGWVEGNRSVAVC